MRFELLSWSRIGDGDYFLLVREIPDRFFFWRPRPRKVLYRGDCTVWREFHSGKRAGTFRESVLSQFWQQIEWGLLERLMAEEQLAQWITTCGRGEE